MCTYMYIRRSRVYRDGPIPFPELHPSEINDEKRNETQTPRVGVSFETIPPETREGRSVEVARTVGIVRTSFLVPRAPSFATTSSPSYSSTLLRKPTRGFARERGNARTRYFTVPWARVGAQKWQGPGNYNGWRKKMAPRYGRPAGWPGRSTERLSLSPLPFLSPFRQQPPKRVCIGERRWLIAGIATNLDRPGSGSTEFAAEHGGIRQPVCARVRLSPTTNRYALIRTRKRTSLRCDSYWSWW